MRTRIREMRRAKGLTLSELAARVSPPTTAQTIGRLETGVRKVTLDWLQKIADAFGCGVHDLMAPEGDAAVPILGTLAADGQLAPAVGEALTLAAPGSGAVAIKIAAPLADLQVGDTLICSPVTPEDALNKDCLVELADGRRLYGRLVAGSRGHYGVIGGGEGGIALWDVAVKSLARRALLIRRY